MTSLNAQFLKAFSILALILLFSAISFAQDITVTVIDEKETLVGVSILFTDSKGQGLSSIGTTTEFDGTATIPRSVSYTHLTLPTILLV